MQRIFRAQPRYWYKETLYPALGLTILFAVILYARSGWPVGVFVLSAVGFLLARDVLLPVKRNHVFVTRESISGCVFESDFDIRWKDLVAAWVSYDRHGQPMLLLGTEQDVFGVSLRWMDAEAVWGAVRRHVGPWALTQDAQNRLWEVISCKLQPSQTQDLPLRSGYAAWIQVVGWLSCIVFGYLALLAWNEWNSNLVIVFLTLFAASGMFLLTTLQTITMDSDGIEDHSVFGCFRIRWDEITLIQSDPQSIGLVIHGADKRIVVAGPAHWVGRDREAMLERLQVEIESRQIPIRIDPWLTYRMTLSRNTRVRRK